jgi:hypothetical protein
MPQVHLHIVVDGHEYMPTAMQLTKVGSDRYKYALPNLPAGQHTVQVYWADNKTHKAMGMVHTVRVTVGS